MTKRKTLRGYSLFEPIGKRPLAALRKNSFDITVPGGRGTIRVEVLPGRKREINFGEKIVIAENVGGRLKTKTIKRKKEGVRK